MLLTIESAGQALSLFTSDSPERGATEVAVALGVSKSKAHALLASLASVGLLRRTEAGRYRIGWRVLSLNRVLSETTDFQRYARPVMQTLADRFGEVVHLGALDNGKVVYLEQVQGTSAVQINPPALTSRADLHCNALGKVLLANLPSAGVREMIEKSELPALTPRTITDRGRLERELAEILSRGFAEERGEAFAEVSGVAAPIRAPGPLVLAAIGIAAPSYRFQARRELYCHAIVRAALYVSKLMVDVGPTSKPSKDAKTKAVALANS
jgi:DNA-binding IclR family transcriptional regulator